MHLRVPQPEAERGSAEAEGSLTGATSEADLLALAPLHFVNHRGDRYTGQNERRKLADFSGEDQGWLRRGYDLMLNLFLALKKQHPEREPSRAIIKAFIESGASGEMIRAFQQLGSSTVKEKESLGIARLIHDLRGGAFQALSFRLELFDEETADLSAQTIFFLVRDHLKIMRNGVQDLDPERFEADRQHLQHEAKLLVEKWSDVSFHAAKTPVKVLFQSHYDGALCESCLEFSTLDRIIYNLMNNAAEHSDDGVVHFYLVPLPGDPPVDVRLVFRNQVNEEQQRQLREQFGDDPSEIFRGGFTTGGHGLGMRICADFCAQAYGLSDFQRAKDKGYFGAKWIGDQFTTWFHWPIGNGSIL